MEMVFSCMLMEGSMMENFKMMLCMAKEISIIRTEEFIKGSLRRGKGLDRARLLKKMVR